MNNKINIVSFDVPYPPNYGGIIDVFYKIVELHKTGVKIYLHTFSINKYEPIILNQYCEKVYYYKRNTSFIKIISRTPFIIKTRTSTKLLQNLLKNDAPILFEGLHSSALLKNFNFTNRKILIRAHNIEHHYYNGLYKSESNKLKRLFYKIESKKLKRFEPYIEKADIILAISPFEFDYFRSNYKSNVVYLPVFHQNKKVEFLTARGNYALYQGDLRVADNKKSVQFLLEVFKKLDFPLKVASGNICKKLLEEITNNKNAEFVRIESNEHLPTLINNAHINILPTFQKTGIKLKLINALYNGRFCIANSMMVENTGLEELCEIANSVSEFRKKTKSIIDKDYTKIMQETRIETLQVFDNERNAKLLKKLIQ